VKNLFNLLSSSLLANYYFSPEIILVSVSSRWSRIYQNFDIIFLSKSCSVFTLASNHDLWLCRFVSQSAYAGLTSYELFAGLTRYVVSSAGLQTHCRSKFFEHYRNLRHVVAWKCRFLKMSVCQNDNTRPNGNTVRNKLSMRRFVVIRWSLSQDLPCTKQIPLLFLSINMSLIPPLRRTLNMRLEPPPQWTNFVEHFRRDGH